MRIREVINCLQKEKLFIKAEFKKNFVIKEVFDDSRKVKKDGCFIAIPGIHFDGSKFIGEAIRKGAVLIIGERTSKKFINEKVGYIEVRNSRKTLSIVSALYYGFPSSDLKIIGVTGTKGKTTVVHLLYHIMKNAGLKVGMVSTVKAVINNLEVDTGLHVTNPEPILLQSLLQKMVKEKLEYAIIEVTSHGLDQERVYGINFDIGILTNIYPEHLDYHKTFENYRKTKSKLFTNSITLILNKDDKSFNYLNKKFFNKKKIYTYSQENKSDFVGSVLEENRDYLRFSIRYRKNVVEGTSQLIGKYNLYNILASFVAVQSLGIGNIKTIASLSDFIPPEGRFEKVKNIKGQNIFIDFAHTPDSLENVLRTLLKINNKGRLISIFGCAGERDKVKRYKMGKISGSLADITIITAEDPRSEDVVEICREIKNGCVKAGAKKFYIKTEKLKNLKTPFRLAMRGFEGQAESGKDTETKHKYLIIPDRGEAIYCAINKIAKTGDTIVVCGKGHEKSMCYGNVEYPWSDRKAIELALRGKKARIFEY